MPGGEPTSQVVMVVGAGRGPLVRASLNASRRSKIPVKVCVVLWSTYHVVIVEYTVRVNVCGVLSGVILDTVFVPCS